MAADVAAAIIAVAVIYVLVRPRSKGAEAVKLITDAFASLVTAATKTPE